MSTALHLVGWVLAAILGHAALAELDTLSPLSVHDTVVALQWDAKQPREELNDDLDAVARESGIVVGKAVPGQAEDASTTTVYLYGDVTSVPPGLPGADPAGYSTTNRMSYRDADELRLQAPVGSYFVYGTDADANRIAEFLSGHGFTVDAVLDSNDVSHRIDSVSSETERTARLIFLVIAVAAAGAALLRRREHAVAFLQGLSWRDRLLVHARDVLPRWALAGVPVALGAVAWVYLYNGGHSWPLYLAVTAGLALVLLLVDLLATAAALFLLARLPIVRSLAGALPVRSVAVAAVGVMIATALVLVAAVSQAVDYGADLRSRAQNLEPFDAAGDAVTLATTSLNREMEDADYRELESWLTRADRDGELILAGKDLLQSEDPALAHRQLLYVNDGYLDAQPIHASDGHVVEPASDRATVMIPASLWGSREAIMKSIGWDFLLSDDAKSKHDPEPVRIRDGDHFTYSAVETDSADGGDEAGTDPSRMTDPVVISFPSRTGIMNPTLWSNSANGEAVFPDPSVVERDLAENPKLRNVVLYTSPIAGEAKTQRQLVARHFQSAVTAVGLSVAVLLAACLLVAYLYSRATSQWTFAHHIHGRRFLWTHRRFLLAQLVGLLVVASWIPIDVWRLNREYDEVISSGVLPSTARAVVDSGELAVIGGVSLLIAATVLTATAAAHRRIVRYGCHEA